MANISSNKIFDTEREGQFHFFKNFGIDKDKNDVLIMDTDGVYNGNIFEFKLSINNTQQVLFQAVKYLSRLRITGHPVPKNILLVSLNQSKVYLFDSGDYFNEIHQIYYGGASKNNDGFVIKEPPQEIDYSTDIGASKVLKLLKENNFTKIKIDERCIWGWSEKYYLENPKATKADFLGDEALKNNIRGEIREPNKFKKYILPYKKKTNIEFDKLMDCLNDRLSKKELGAFFTPPAYAKKSVELVRKAIKLVPKGNDYIILDRCAGTGSLEVELSDEELSHTIVSTYEYYEWRILWEKMKGKVRDIIPPTEQNVVYQSGGKISNADALSEDFVNNEIIKQYIDNPECTVILFENPPYSDVGAVKNNPATKNKTTSWKNSFIAEQMKKEITGTVKNDLANLFIWSGFKYYLRQETDSFILFSPVKYWKSNKLVNKKFNNGFIFNRRHFHANASAISCISWQNIDEIREKIELEVYDIDTNKTSSVNDKIVFINKITVKKVSGLLSKFYDKRIDSTDQVPAAISAWGGREYQYKSKWNEQKFDYKSDKSLRIIPKYNKNIIAYLITQDFGFEHPRLSTNLVRTGVYAGNGFYLRNDNYLEKLPLFATGKYPIEEKWYENGIIFKSSDDGDKYTKDKNFLKSCFIFTCLSRYNKCISFIGSDKRFYKNELCFDNGTLANEQLGKLKLNSKEKELIKIFGNVLAEAKKTENYDKKLAYGPYQIEIELNTTYKDENEKTVYDYPTLNGELENLKKKLKIYYAKYITPKLFKYELLK